MEIRKFRLNAQKKSCKELESVLSILVAKLKRLSAKRKQKRRLLKLKIRVVQRLLENKCNKKIDMQKYTKRQAADVATMYGTFLNQTGRRAVPNNSGIGMAPVNPGLTMAPSTTPSILQGGAGGPDVLPYNPGLTVAPATNINTVRPTAIDSFGNAVSPVNTPATPYGITTTFVNNMNEGYANFGCEFLFNRLQSHQNTLRGLSVSGGGDLSYQQSLADRIAWIQSFLVQTGCSQTTSTEYVDSKCEEYAKAYLWQSWGTVNKIIVDVASHYNISAKEAAILLAERCLCNGLNIDEPEPIDCDYLISNGYCEEYNAAMANNDVQQAMAVVNSFALASGLSSSDAYSLIRECCEGCPDCPTGDMPCEEVPEDWCIKFRAAYPFGMNSVNMQGTVNPFIQYAAGRGYTLTYDQAYSTLLRCCGEPVTPTNPCEDPDWVNLQDGGLVGQPGYNGGKNNYCDRCNEGTGSFPVRFINGMWQYDPQNGTDYCQCCPPSDPDIPCSTLENKSAICWHYNHGIATNDNTLVNSAIAQTANQLGMSGMDAAQFLQRCCADEPYSPCMGANAQMLSACCTKCNTPGSVVSPDDPCWDFCQDFGECCTSSNDGPGTGGVTPPPPVNPQVNTVNNNMATPMRFSGASGQFMFGDY